MRHAAMLPRQRSTTRARSLGQEGEEEQEQEEEEEQEVEEEVEVEEEEVAVARTISPAQNSLPSASTIAPSNLQACAVARMHVPQPPPPCGGTGTAAQWSSALPLPWAERLA